MKILLFALNGSYTHTNLAIRCLREPLERAGFEVQLLERNLRDRTAHILHDIVAAQADIVGFSTYIWNVQQMLALSRDLKALRPDCHVIFGGPEVSYGTERFLSDEYHFIDAFVCGEGETALTALCRALRDGERIPRVWDGDSMRPSSMPDAGILYREHDFPAGSMLYYESSRGCPFSCAYCLSSATHGVRAKEVAQVLTDLRAFEQLPDHIRIIKFVDRTFNFSPARANAIWETLLNDAFTRHYHFEICADLLNEDSFAILARFPKGKIQLEIGLQSTHAPTLQAVSRHIDPDRVLANVRRIHEMGNIHVHLDLIAGLPYETYARFAASFDAAYPCCDLLQLGFLKLLYGTELRRRAGEYGYVCRHEPPYTVLQSHWITYEQMARLESIAEILERYRESGKFDRCLALALTHVPSPFGFYEGLCDFIAAHDGRHIQKISQADAYRLLYEYVATLLPAATLEAFSEAMHLDFCAGEVRKAPAFLRK